MAPQVSVMRGRTAVSGLTLDTGALIAIDRGTEDVRVLLRRARAHGWPIVIPTGALAQAWRGGERQARLAGFLRTRRDGPVLHPVIRTISPCWMQPARRRCLTERIIVVGWQVRYVQGVHVRYRQRKDPAAAHPGWDVIDRRFGQ